MRLAVLLTVFFTPILVVAREGHDAGYNWAWQKGIDDPDNCYSRSGGYISNSPSFTKGCLEFLRDEGVTDDGDEIIDEWGDEDDEW